MPLDNRSRETTHVLFELRGQYPAAVANGVLQRLRLNRDLFHGADDLLAAAAFSLEDDALLEIALAETGPRDLRASAAVSVLGPHSVGHMIDGLLEARAATRKPDGSQDRVAADRYHELLDRIAHAPAPSLLAAIEARSAAADNDQMASLAELIWRHPNGENDRGRPFDTSAVATIATLAQNWGDRLLASGRATRPQLVSVVQATNRSPSVALLPLIKRLLDEDQRQWREFRQQAIADQFRNSAATNQSRMVYTLQYQRAFDAIRKPETAALMCEYLDDPNFGQCAAIVLSEQWRAVNEPDDSSRFRGVVDLSRIEDRRAARVASPDATSTEAEAIFRVIDELIVDEASDDQKKHAVALGTVASRLPHGQRNTTIEKLLALAPQHARAAMAQSLVLSGEVIDISVVRDGVAELLKEAKTKPWILTQDAYQLKEWLRLLPFTDRPIETLQILQGLPAPQHAPWSLDDMIGAFEAASLPEAKDVLFQLAVADPRFYEQHAWRAAVIKRGSVATARRFIDLARSGALGNNGTGRLEAVRHIGSLIGDFPELRAYVYGLLAAGLTSPGLDLLARAIEDNPDTNGLLLLIRIEMTHGRSYVNWRTIEKVITSNIPVEGWASAYNIAPVSAAELRKELLAMSAAGQRENAATSCLSKIDSIRDSHGALESDPRHPDLASGLAWPALVNMAQSQAT